MIGRFYSRAEWRKSINRNRQLFVGFLQIRSDNTVETLKSAATVGYSVHSAPLNLWQRKIRWRIGNGATIVGFVLMRCREEEIFRCTD